VSDLNQLTARKAKIVGFLEQAKAEGLITDFDTFTSRYSKGEGLSPWNMQVHLTFPDDPEENE
jgi:hypothetical protein